MKVWIAATLLVVCQCNAVTRRDTYLSAYMDSHGPDTAYGAPAVGYNYGAPSMGYNYGAPAEAAEPHSAPINPLDPIHAKAVLLFKILLKILIFKLIVKFIAIICVLFFLPKLSELGVAKEESRILNQKVTDMQNDESLRLTQFVLDAVSGRRETEACGAEGSAGCVLLRAVRSLDRHYSVHRLYKMYFKEESGRLRKRYHKS